MTRTRDPYRVPRPAVISFSGGRTSGYMLKHVLDAHGGRLPGDVAVVFANTGMECHPATLDLVAACGRAWAMDIVWVEYDWDLPRRTRVVHHPTAPRDGQSYERLVGCRIYRRKTRILHYIRVGIARIRFRSCA